MSREEESLQHGVIAMLIVGILLYVFQPDIIMKVQRSENRGNIPVYGHTSAHEYEICWRNLLVLSFLMGALVTVASFLMGTEPVKKADLTFNF